MAALGAAANRRSRGTPKSRRFLMAASTQIWKGGLVAVNASGLAVPAADTAGTAVVGVAAESVLSAASGSYWVRVEYDAEWEFAASSITQAMVGLVRMVVVNDNTVDDAAGPTNDIDVGMLTEFTSATLGWVHVPGPSK